MVAESFIEALVQNWPVVLALALASYLIKNRFNRGLNKYPGPFLASITDWWRFWVVYKRRPEVEHIKLHAKHGDVVRLGPNSLSFSNPQTLKAIYGLNKGFTKSEFYPVQQSVANGHRLPSLFSTTSEAFHAQLRRCVNSAFSMSTLVQYEPFVDSTTDLFLSQTEKLYVETGKSCDFSRWLQFYAFDVIGEMTYSKRHGFVEENEDIEGIVKYLGKIFDYAAPIGQIPFLDRLLLKNPLYLLAAQYGLIDATFPVARFAKQRMAERYPADADKSASVLPSTEPKGKPTQPDLLSKFMQAKEARPDFMNDTLVTTMAVSMAFAGSETTAISLSAVFYFLLKNPVCLSALLDELDAKAKQAFFSNKETGVVTWAESQELPYLDACIKESFRLHPAPGLHLERIVPEKGAEIGGEWVKGGTIVGCSAWVIHRRPEVFGDDVEDFRPERWLVGGGKAGDGAMDSSKVVDKEAEEKRIKEMGACLLHFGMGSRTCIGKNISLLEVYKLVPTFLRRFEVQLEDPSKEWTVHNAWPKAPTEARLPHKEQGTTSI
ncbi:Cytochrome P450 [Venustampulla echinocandica]|uniref:Cytochrome P450 n=1 Tax=Venustampulla echinocandica TaxID=2656787 RepID=A0A370TN78_9HELO|nr:Cytochrome P450 [Venustampulla echinocandica]RDL36969.1 Cytochrome P450 [Venustampulla echinocandica]